MKKIIFLLFISLGLAACKTTVPVMNVDNTSVYGEPTLADVKESIITALEFKRWTPISSNDNRIEAEIWVRSHYALITIEFTKDNYSIKYQDSNNLDYDASSNGIHRNYNKWITLLDQEIKKNIRRSSL